MSTEVYFAVVQHHGVESPRRFFGEVPRVYSQKERAKELVYCTRLDDLPNGDTMIAAPLDQLMRVYRALMRANKLPAQNRGQKPKAPEGKTTRGLGDWWEPPAPSWDPWAPFEGWPEPQL